MQIKFSCNKVIQILYTIHIPRQFKWLNYSPKDKTKRLRIYQKMPNWMKRERGNFIQIESYTNPESKYQQAKSNNKVPSRSELWVFLTRCTLAYEQMPPTLVHWAISDLFGESLLLLLTIPDVAFPWAHLLEVQYNAFEDKDNMLFIVFMCFVLDLTAKM